MSKNDAKRPLYLTVDDELKARLEIAFRAARKGRKGYYMNDFLEALLRETLDSKDDLFGSRAALANRVGDRLSARMDNFQIVLWAIFHVLCIKLDIDPTQRKAALLWAVQHRVGMEQRIAEFRNIPLPPLPANDNSDNTSK